MVGYDYGVTTSDDKSLHIVVRENGSTILDRDGDEIGTPFYYMTPPIPKNQLVVIGGRVFIRWRAGDEGLVDENTDIDDDIRRQCRNSPLYGCYMVVDVDGELGFAIQTHTANAYCFDDDDNQHVAEWIYSLDNNRWKYVSIREFDNGTIDLVYDTGYYWCTAEERFYHESELPRDRPSCCRRSGTWNYRGEWVTFVANDERDVIDDQPLLAKSEPSEMDWLEQMTEGDS